MNIISDIIVQQSNINEAIHQLFDAVDAISVQGYDEQRCVVYWNMGSEALYGYSESDALGKRLEDLIIPKPMQAFVIAAHADWVSKGVVIPAAELTLRHKNGLDVQVFSSHVMFTNQFNKKEMYCIDINLAEVKRAQDEAVFKHNMLSAVLEATPDAFFLMKEDGTVVEHYENNSKESYVFSSEFIGDNICSLLPNTVTHKLLACIQKAVKSGRVIHFEYDLDSPDGKKYFEARVSRLVSHHKVVIIVRDITEQHQSAELIRQHAYFDMLTLLPNRFLSLDRLSALLSEAEKNNVQAAILFLDLDDFKKVNDSLGHEVGDKLLIESAKRLHQSIDTPDMIGRLGGDEFMVLLSGLDSVQKSSTCAKKLLDVFREPFLIDDRTFILTVSIGIAVYPDNGLCVSEVLRSADAAMYEAKSLGRNTYSFFTKKMHLAMLRRFDIEEQMQTALENNEFEVFYQPKFNAHSHQVIGAEALLRWHNPVLGNVTPDEFIPIAEHTGLIVPIGQFVITQALAFLTCWEEVHACSYAMAVNVSPRQFRDVELINFIKAALKKSKVPPEKLEFEITEGVLMIGQSYIDDALSDIHDIGINLAMDDFGTGYSSLSYLRQYAFDVLKIDRSFINGITENTEDVDLVKATIAMAHSLGLTVVAEGVETKDQLTLLDELNCDLVQGYYFSKALRGDDLLEWPFK